MTGGIRDPWVAATKPDDLTLSRTDPDWLLHVSDFAQWQAVALHVKPTARLNVRQFSATEHHPAFVTLEFGPHAQIFLSRFQAAALGDALDAISAGASEGDIGRLPPPNATVAAPAEPTWNRFPDQFKVEDL